MIDKKLGITVKTGKAISVHASITREDMGKSVTVFDTNLSSLCKALQELVPATHFDFNMSAERYKICLPEMEKSVAEKVHKLLLDTPISITADAHFGGLF